MLHNNGIKCGHTLVNKLWSFQGIKSNYTNGLIRKELLRLPLSAYNFKNDYCGPRFLSLSYNHWSQGSTLNKNWKKQREGNLRHLHLTKLNLTKYKLFQLGNKKWDSLDSFMNRPFPSYFVSLFQNESSCKTFDLHENELVSGTHFHMNGFALTFVLTQK